MVRTLADHDPVRALAVFRWPLREALLSYVERLKAAARREYEHQVSVWAALAPYKKNSEPPRLPSILRGE